MTSINYAQALSEVRRTATKNGMTFKREETRIPSESVKYEFVDQKTGNIIESGFKLWNAYENCMSGYVATLNN